MARQILPFVALLLGMVFLMLGGGLHALLIPVRGEIEGFSSFSLGWIGTSFAVGFTFGCLYIPRLVRRAGHVRTFSTLTALLSVAVLGNAFYVEVWWWVLLRALSGFCFAGCYMVAESWLNERVSNEWRGSMFSIYAITTFVAMGAGQYFLVLSDPQGDRLFMLCAVLFALAVVPTAVSRAQSPAPLTETSIDVRSLFLRSPAGAVGAFFSGIISASWTNFGPVFGQQVGLSAAGIASLLAAAMLGSVLFQWPMGKLSDMIDRRYVMGFAGLVGILFGSVMTWQTSIGSFGTFFYICVVGYGGVIFSIYSIAVAHANDRADASEFVKVSSGLLILYGFGTMVGPLLSAGLMDALGPSGVFASTTIAHATVAAYAFYRTFRSERVSQKDRTDFQPTPTTRVSTPESYTLDPRHTLAGLDEATGEFPPMPPPVQVKWPGPGKTAAETESA